MDPNGTNRSEKRNSLLFLALAALLLGAAGMLLQPSLFWADPAARPPGWPWTAITLSLAILSTLVALGWIAGGRPFEAALRSLEAAASRGSARVDSTGKILWMDETFRSLIACPTCPTGGESLSSVLHRAGSTDPTAARLLSAISRGTSFHGTFLIGKDGESGQWIEAVWQPSTRKGRPLGGLLTFSDASPIAAADAAAKRSRSLLQSAAESLSLAGWESSGPNQPPCLLEEFNAIPALATHKGGSLTDLLAPDAARELQARIETAWAAGDEWAMECLVERPSGPPLWLFISGHAEVRRGVVQRVRGVVQDISQAKLVQQEHLASLSTDPITGVLNRQEFCRRAGKLLGNLADPSKPCAVIIVDIDGFRSINRTHGQTHGDSVLRACAHRMNACLHSAKEAGSITGEALLARTKGDEFSVLITGLSRATSPDAIARLLSEEIHRPLTVGKEVHHLRTSLGVAEASIPQRSYELTIAEAEDALSRAKLLGGGQVRSAGPGLRLPTGHRPSLHLDLLAALDADGFSLAYLPIFDLVSGELAAMEAQVRWTHPLHGVISSQEFFALANETGLILPIGDWALAQALKQVDDWDARWPSARLGRVQLRVEPLQLEGPSFSTAVYREMALHPNLTGRVSLELAEEGALALSRGGLTSLKLARAAGLKVILDELQPELAPFERLGDLPIDGLRLGKDLLAKLNGSPFPLDPALPLNSLELSADGISSPSEAAEFVKLGCRTGQGAFFGSPLSAEDAGRLLAASSMTTGIRRPTWVA
jgi:diguanylate cyclase (GGDEF)-like protein